MHRTSDVDELRKLHIERYPRNPVIIPDAPPGESEAAAQSLETENDKQVGYVGASANEIK